MNLLSGAVTSSAVTKRMLNVKVRDIPHGYPILSLSLTHTQTHRSSVSRQDDPCNEMYCYAHPTTGSYVCHWKYMARTCGSSWCMSETWGFDSHSCIVIFTCEKLFFSSFTTVYWTYFQAWYTDSSLTLLYICSFCLKTYYNRNPVILYTRRRHRLKTASLTFARSNNIHAQCTHFSTSHLQLPLQIDQQIIL